MSQQKWKILFIEETFVLILKMMVKTLLVGTLLPPGVQVSKLIYPEKISSRIFIIQERQILECKILHSTDFINLFSISHRHFLLPFFSKY